MSKQFQYKGTKFHLQAQVPGASFKTASFTIAPYDGNEPYVWVPVSKKLLREILEKFPNIGQEG
jgi:hypothetical protein